MRIYSWNVNGIRAVVRKGALQEFMSKHQPDILCLQEIKAQQGQAPWNARPGEPARPIPQGQAEIDFEGYEEYWNSAAKAGYSGTAIFTKIKPLKIENGFPEDFVAKYKLRGDVYGDPNKEGRVITAEFDKFFIVGVYTINIKDDLSRLDIRQAWDKAFIAWCQQLEKKKPVIFCGDLNVAHTEDDLARPKENIGKRGFTNEERAGFQALVDHGFIDTFRLFKQGSGYYSWWTHWANARARNVGWRIDYFLVSAKLKDKIRAAEIHADITGSDHAPVSIELEI